MLKSAHIVTAPEKALIDAIEALRYGEIVDLDVENTGPNVAAKLTEKQAALISFLRAGHSHIDRLIVHESDPMQVENDLELNGYKCIRKLRL